MGRKKPDNHVGKYKTSELIHCKNHHEARDALLGIAERYQGARWNSGESATKYTPEWKMKDDYPL